MKSYSCFPNMWLKAFAVALSLFLSSFAPTPVVAVPNSSAQEIWVVDMQKVISESSAGQAARTVIEGEAKKREGKIRGLNAELEKNRAEFEKQSSLLAAEALQSRREALIKREREVAREIQDAQEDLQRKNNSEISKLVGQIRGIVAELAEKQKLPIVLERDERLVLFVNSQYDLTPEVIKILNARNKGS